MADTEESTRSELIKEVPDEVTEEHDKSVSPETAGPDVPLQTMPSSGASATVSTETARPDVPLKTTPNPGVSVTISTESAWPDVALQTTPNPGPSATVSTETAGPDVPLQTMPSPGASATAREGFSLPCGGTACEDASQTQVIPAALSTDSQVAPTTSEDTQRRNVSGPMRGTGSSDVSLSNEETAGSILTLAGSESDSTVTTQPAGEAGSPAASQGDTIKVEVDYVEQTEEDMEEGEEEDVKNAPVISSAHEEGSFCSLDMGVDMVENMDTGTNEQIAQEVEKNEEEEEDKRTFVRQDSTESKSSIVNAVSIKENAQSLAILSEENARGQSPHMEENKQQLDLSSSSSSGEATPRPVSTGPAAKDNPRVLKNGVRRRQRGEQEKVEVKDEPVDEGYDKALAPTNAASEHVKDEPETEEDNLKISAVFSVGGASSPSVTTASPVLTSAQARDQVSSAPPLIPSSMCVACSGCKKILTKGQTAYQKKGSSHLFCSTKCLTSYSSAPSPLIKPSGKRTCHYCLKDVQSPTLLIKAPVDASGTMKDFCGQACLTSFNFKRQSAVSTLSSPAVSSSSTPTLNTSKARLANKCSACKKSCLCYSHEVVNQGVMHKLCSDVCFKSFCSTNQLALNSCTNCRSICQGKTPQMTVSGVIKSFCNTACQAAYKQKNKSPVPCAMCRACRPMTEMVEVNDSEGVVQLYCTTACVTAFKVQTVSASGAPVECENCRQRKVPAYHLAMSDSSIRNFCTLNCVLSFQEQFNKDNTQNPTNVAQTATVPPPAPPSQSQTSQTAPSTGGGTKLPCYQCHRLFTTKPELLQINDKLVFLCGSLCSEKYKKLNPTADRCEYCKIEKITTEVHRINGKDCAFCSEGCKLLYKHDLTKLWGRHCRSCSYCSSTSQKLVTGQFAGKYENFCSETCRSKYTMLFCQVAKCDTCGRQGKLTETLPMLGEVKHFCDLQCLMQFCSQKNLRQARVQTKVPISIAPTVGTTVANSANPVIANVVSLASTPAGQPNVFANTALQGAVPSAPTKIVGNASTQTASAPQPPPRVLKNKALLCKPIVQNKGIICKPQMVNSECQTDETLPKVLVLPVPVPVYVPVPMNLYAQYTPKPLGLPIPVPVPMFLPVTLDNAERIVETIQEIKERIPSNPFEADVLLMAEMVAEEEEGEKEERKPSSTHIQDDRLSNFSEDLNTDDLTSFLDDWQEESTSSGLRANRPNRLYSSEKLPPILDIPVGDSEPPPPPAIMDIESEFPIETLEQMAHRRQRALRSPSPPPPPSPPLRKSRRKVQQKKKKGRRSRASAAEKETATAVVSVHGGQAGSLEPPKLQNKYGVDAWRRWVQRRSTQPDVEPLPRFGMRPMVLKEDVLQCTTAELGFGLCRFICEVKRPDGQPYSPDSLFYLCLGIQQYLFENGRMENIFTDVFYGKFTMEISNLLKDFQPTITASGYIHSRVEEDYLWDCKQLGAYSPIVLLNTLLFFCTKLFGFRTLAQHRQLSFGHVMRCTASYSGGTKTNFLRFYPPIPVKEQAADAEGVAAKKRKEDPEKENVLEMVENSENPLRCPVRLYEFYLSKCSESVKQRTNLFYLHPERSCVPNSPLWYSSMPLDNATMEAMLTRILTIREIHLPTEGPRVMATEGGRAGAKRKGEKTVDETYSPPAYEDDDDEDYSD